MEFWTMIKLSVKTLVRNKVRTLLTMLGIIIGVAAVITMLAITSGAQKKIISHIQSFGNNTMFISYNWRYTRNNRGARRVDLNEKDAEAIQDQCKHVVYCSPRLSSQVKLINGNRNHSTLAQGGTENMDYIQGWKVDRGRFVTKGEMTSGAKVCVIGTLVEEALFNAGEDPLNKFIRIDRIPFRVVGVFESRGSSGGEQDQDDFIFVPYSTMKQRMYRRRRMRLVACAKSLDELAPAKEEVLQLLQQRYKIKENPEQIFDVRTQEEIMEMVKKFTNTFALFLGAVASISLLVGGIGIMNIMLVSVNERIREIGIRMALGAKSRDILGQFLIESVTLSVLGGLLGVGLGYLASSVVKELTQWDLYISMFSIILSISFASVVGIFFGFYPAWKASKLDPIQALRHE